MSETPAPYGGAPRGPDRDFAQSRALEIATGLYHECSDIVETLAGEVVQLLQERNEARADVGWMNEAIDDLLIFVNAVPGERENVELPALLNRVRTLTAELGEARVEVERLTVEIARLRDALLRHAESWELEGFDRNAEIARATVAGEVES